MSIFKQSTASFNSEIKYTKTACCTKAKRISNFYYLPIAGRTGNRFMIFPRVLALGKTQTALSRI